MSNSNEKDQAVTISDRGHSMARRLILLAIFIICFTNSVNAEILSDSSKHERTSEIHGQVCELSLTEHWSYEQWTLHFHRPHSTSSTSQPLNDVDLLEGALLDGDFDGDGDEELLVTMKSGNSRYLITFSDDSGAPSVTQAEFPQHIGSTTLFAAGDLDGDGCDDLLAFGKDQGAWFVRSSCSGAFAATELQGIPGAPPLLIAAVDTTSGEEKSLLMSYQKDRTYLVSGDFAKGEIKRAVAFGDYNLAGAGVTTRNGSHKRPIFREPELGQVVAIPLPAPNNPASYGDVLFELSPRIVGPFLASYGDFNGDGLLDMLIQAYKDKFEWWLGYGTGAGGLEQQIAPPPVGLPLQSRVVLDSNGDGVDEIVSLESPGHLKRFTLAPKCSPVAGAQVSLGGQSVVTGPDGMFFIREGEPVGEDADAEEEIRIQDSNREFVQTVRKSRRKKSGRAGINFLAIPKELRPGFRGQSVGFGPTLGGPYVYSGYNQHMGQGWGKRGSAYDCGKNYAFLNLREFRKSNRGADVPAVGNCIRLPAEDVLLSDEVRWTSTMCPDGYVATAGNDSVEQRPGNSLLRCSKINSQRYQLGVTRGGVYWGYATGSRRESHRLILSTLPAVLRYGLQVWTEGQELDGCIGLPWGSLVVGKSGGGCSGTHYRRLEYIGAPGDPPRGTEVKMFPDCVRLEKIGTPFVRCSEDGGVSGIRVR